MRDRRLLFARLGALFYDSIVIFTLLVAATGMAMLWHQQQAIAAGTVWFQVYLLLVLFTFYSWCFTRSGQTLGMASWRLRLVNQQGQCVSVKQVAWRFILMIISVSCFALGWLWCLVDRDGQTLYDRWSGCHVLRCQSAKT